MSLQPYALTTRERLIDFMGATGLSATEEAVLDRLINAATEFVENYCGRRFIQTTYADEEYDGENAEALLLRNYPITTFTRLQVRSSLANEDKWETIDSDQYFVYEDRGYLEFIKGRRFHSEKQFYRVTYTAGFTFDNITPGTTLEAVGLGDLEYAVWKLCVSAYNKRKGGSDIQAERLGSYSVTFRKETMESEEILDILEDYARQDYG